MTCSTFGQKKLHFILKLNCPWVLRVYHFEVTFILSRFNSAALTYVAYFHFIWPHIVMPNQAVWLACEQAPGAELFSFMLICLLYLQNFFPPCREPALYCLIRTICKYSMLPLNIADIIFDIHVYPSLVFLWRLP